MNRNISVEEAARIMGASAQFVRMGLRDQRFPFGYAVKMPGGRWSYYINEKKFREEFGDYGEH